MAVVMAVKAASASFGRDGAAGGHVIAQLLHHARGEGGEDSIDHGGEGGVGAGGGEGGGQGGGIDGAQQARQIAWGDAGGDMGEGEDRAADLFGEGGIRGIETGEDIFAGRGGRDVQDGADPVHRTGGEGAGGAGIKLGHQRQANAAQGFRRGGPGARHSQRHAAGAITRHLRQQVGGAGDGQFRQGDGSGFGRLIRDEGKQVFGREGGDSVPRIGFGRAGRHAAQAAGGVGGNMAIHQRKGAIQAIWKGKTGGIERGKKVIDHGSEGGPVDKAHAGHLFGKTGLMLFWHIGQ